MPASGEDSLARPKVVFITSHFPFDGKEPFLYPELRELEKSIDVSVVPVASAMRNCWFPDILDRVEPVNGPFALATFADALREFLRSPVRVLKTFYHVVTAPRNTTARFRNAAVFFKALAVTRLIRALEPAHIHAYWLSTPATVAYTASRLTGIPWSASGHRWELFDNNLSSVGSPNAGFIRSAQFLRAVSNEGVQRMETALGAQTTGKVNLIHLGVVLPDDVAAKTAQLQTTLRVACIATLTPVKGHDVLLHAIRKLKEAGTAIDCTLIGSGPLHEDIERKIDDLGLTGSVRMVSQMSHEKLLACLQEGSFDAVVLTSRHEGIPVSLIEAMAAELPVLATRAGGVPDLVDTSNGILVDIDDVDAVANGLAALAGDVSLRARLGKSGRAKVDQEFNIRKTAARLAKLIQDCAWLSQPVPQFLNAASHTTVRSSAKS